MTADELFSRIGDYLSVQRVFGEPVDREGVTLVPVAVVIGGAGGGQGPADTGVGGGYGVWARGVGAYTIREGQVSFVPAVDVLTISLAGMMLTGQLIRLLSKRRRRSR